MGASEGKPMIVARWMLSAGMLMIAMMLAGQARAAEGLWVGNVQVDAVSDVNRPISDLSFDLQLEGTLLEDDLVATQSTWRYDSGEDHGILWRQAGFDDSDWSDGAGPFGYGGSQAAATCVGYCGDPAVKHPTSYFRKEFIVEDASQYANLLLSIRRDDGIAIYINGVLVLKDNLPNQLTSYDTLALTSIETDETSFQDLTIPAGALVDGTNLLAVEVHIASPDEEDMGFDLALVGQREATSAILIGARSNDWAYSDSGDELPLEWRNPGYAESGWKTGAAPLGYGDGDYATVVSAGPDNSMNNPVTYFRKQFDVTNTDFYSHLNVSLQRDDGAVVYLNGQEILRSNMPEGEILYTSLPLEAAGASDESRYYQQLVPLGLLQNGSNVIAVEVHQHAAELNPFDRDAPPAPVPTASTLSLRLLLHEDTGGQVNLLKQVIQMWQDGTLNPDGSENTPGYYVLLTDDSLIPQYKGVALRNSSLVGRRISTVGFDFPGDLTPLNGTMDVNQTVTGSFVLPGDHPTHPRRHRYHPEHDNLNATYSGPANDVPAIERTITLEIDDRYPPDPNEPEQAPPPGWGETQIGGIYRETIIGLHRDPIVVKGVFTLNRASSRGVLNE